MTTIQKPTPGRVVTYVSKIGDGVESPALILRTKDTTVREVIDRWGPEPQTVVAANDPNVTHKTAARPDALVAELPDDTTVDLLVHGLGKDYREYAVPYGFEPGNWHYPEITQEMVEV